MTALLKYYTRMLELVKRQGPEGAAMARDGGSERVESACWQIHTYTNTHSTHTHTHTHTHKHTPTQRSTCRRSCTRSSGLARADEEGSFVNVCSRVRRRLGARDGLLLPSALAYNGTVV
jgi:hypothetical protein